VVVICLSSQYKESQACRTEAEYAYKLKKDVICIMAEDGYTPKGWLGILLGNKLWYNPWQNPDGFITGSVEIIKAAKKILAEKSHYHGSNTITSSTPHTPVLPCSVHTTSSNLMSSFPPPTTTGSNSIYVTAFGVQVPTDKTPLPAEQLQYNQVLKWGNTEVCRWLYTNQLEELLPMFVFHKFNGEMLLELSDLKNTDSFWRALEHPQNSSTTAVLRCRRALAFLEGPISKISEVSLWSSDLVGKWLDSCHLNELGKIARKANWDGRILVALNQVKRDASFESYCKNLKVKETVDQLLLLAELSKLFA